MDRAQDWPSFQAALKLWHSPEQNIVYADTDGHIAFTSVGTLPIRKRPTDDFPAAGATGEADWTGLADFTQLPEAVDPATHRFINANNQVVPDNFPLYIGRHYDGKTGLSADDFAHMQLDVKEQDADLLLPLLLQAKPITPAGQKALAMLAAWDRMMDRGRPEPLIYSAWVSRLKRALVDKRGGAATADLFGSGLNPALVVRLLAHYSADGSTEADTVLAATLDQSVALLVRAYGDDLAMWRWGDAHKAALTSQLLGQIPLLGDIFDISRPASGGAETVNRAGFGRTDGVHFPDTHGPGYRGVFDLADLESSRFIIATGESGNPLSRHFSDLSERWRDGSGITLSGTADQVTTKGLGRQHFAP
jgi:penicillin amidase